jgi:hypothetical protein
MRQLLKHLVLLTVALLGLAALAVGCGGDSEESSASQALTKAQFIKKGDAICGRTEAKAQREIGPAFEKYTETHGGSSSSPKAEEAVAIELVLPLLETQTAAIGQLQPPADDESQIEAMVEKYEEVNRRAKGDPSVLIEYETGLLAEARKLARQYGLKNCG